MKIEIPAKLDPLSPHHWDFRSVPENCLNEVLEWEYLRSCERFRKIAIEWLDETKIRGKIVRQHLIELHKSPKKLTGKLREELLSTAKLGNPYIFFETLENDPAFPSPWTWLVEKKMLIPCEPNKSKKQGSIFGPDSLFFGLSVSRLDREAISYLHDTVAPGLGENGFCGYHLKIDFRNANNREIKRAFSEFLSRAAKDRRTKAKSGKNSSKPWHELKQLAAYRLDLAKIKREQAKEMCVKRQREYPLSNSNDVLPIYESAGAWHGAISAAKIQLNKLESLYLR